MKTLAFVLVLLGTVAIASCGDGGSMDQQSSETGVMGAMASGTPTTAMTPTMGMMGTTGM